MAEWKMKRFWTAANVVEQDGGFSVQLDGRQVKTPAKAALVVPTRGLAEAIAAEWDAQSGEVNPQTMPYTRSANAAIDKVTVQFQEVSDLIAAYGETDLLYYRAATPQELIDRQGAAWDPILNWASDCYDVKFSVGHGVMFIEQPPVTVEKLIHQVKLMTPFHLTAFHDLVSMTGSLILGFAVTKGIISAQQAWDLSRVDENWQIEQWGHDEEADRVAALKCASMLHAGQFYSLCA